MYCSNSSAVVVEAPWLIEPVEVEGRTAVAVALISGGVVDELCMPCVVCYVVVV